MGRRASVVAPSEKTPVRRQRWLGVRQRRQSGGRGGWVCGRGVSPAAEVAGCAAEASVRRQRWLGVRQRCQSGGRGG